MADTGDGVPPAPGAPEPEISAGRFLIPSIILLTIVVPLVPIRAYFRIYRNSMWRNWRNCRKSAIASEVLVFLAWLAAFGQFGLLCAAIPYGFGRHYPHPSIDSQIEGRKLMQMSYLPWRFGVAFAKIDFALLVMRIAPSPCWKFDCKFGRRFGLRIGWGTGCWAIITIQVIVSLLVIILLLASCQPIEASWNPMVINAKCWKPVVFQVSLYTMGATDITTDIFFASFFTTIRTSLGHSWPEKTRSFLRVNIGIFSLATTVVKLYFLRRLQLSKEGDQLFLPHDLAICSTVETLVSIIASCIPVLRSTMKCLFRRVDWAGPYRYGSPAATHLHNRSHHSNQSQQPIAPQQQVGNNNGITNVQELARPKRAVVADDSRGR